ncbi:superinfection immunity protein [Paraburkholderia sp. GAS199]|uniref:superinfection immunity protein n=1 Tax=Paraburkholderia sp. GAS199 TaxID=3035126 RepID=UPI003D1B0AC7
MAGNIVVQAVAAVIALGLYFLPSILADRRKRHDLLTIALFNACIGWTGFGWLLALYWALQPNPPKNIAGEVVETRKLVRMRAFSSALLVRVQRRAASRDSVKK